VTILRFVRVFGHYAVPLPGAGRGDSGAGHPRHARLGAPARPTRM